MEYWRYRMDSEKITMKISAHSLKIYYSITILLYLLAFCRIIRLLGETNIYYITGVILIGVITILCILLCLSDKRFSTRTGWKELRNQLPKGSRVIFYLAILVVTVSLAI